MWEASYPFFEWHEHSWLGQLISGSTWLFPAVETIHILAMTIMFGALMVINLRLLGLGMRKFSVATLAKGLMPYVNWGLVVMLLSGYGLFSSEGVKSFSNDGFKFKMAALATVLVFQYTLYWWLIHRDDDQRPMLLGGIGAVLSFLLWFCVGAGGRAIGFV
jgi:hypothetical protein